MPTLLVTGASGFFGRIICKQATRKWNVVGISHSQNISLPGVALLQADLTNENHVAYIFEKVNPGAVIHSAAAAKPDFCEVHPVASFNINVTASSLVARQCEERNIPCVFISTDLVFDGLKAPYREDDPVSPVCEYGKQKVLAEQKILGSCSKAVVVRLPLMFGSAGPGAASFIQPLIRAMMQGTELHLFTDEFRTPVSAGSAAEGIFKVMNKSGEIFHLGGLDRISRYDIGVLIKDIIRLENAVIQPCLQKNRQFAAPRPPDVSLSSSKARAYGFRPKTLMYELQELKQTLLAELQE